MSASLAAYAVTPDTSRNRLHPTDPHPYRTPFQRDRDRIIHSQAFRRLEGKTQVFTPGINDSYRNRLTHSIEVAQIGRTIAKTLCLNTNLTEAVCLGHDLGHSPFGHTGETVLNELMAPFGGFEHNAQALRIVDLLEHPYPDFAGLNLMYETRLGFAKHQSPYDKPAPTPDFHELRCSLEGQIAIIADRIAYNCHDLEDGMRSRIIDLEQLQGIDLAVRAQRNINAPAITDLVCKKIRTAKAIIDILVSDCINTSRKTIAAADPKSLEDVYSAPASLIVLSKDAEDSLRQLETFLLNHIYLSDRLHEAAFKARAWLTDLFEKLCENPKLMPNYYQDFIPTQGLQRTICDYIAGMTDRYCLAILDK